MRINPCIGFLFCLLVLVPAGAFARKPQTVVIENMVFTPSTLTVQKDDVVVWINKDFVPHSVTAKEFDSKAISAGKSWRYTFHKRGSFNYHCQFHPTMMGGLLVK